MGNKPVLLYSEEWCVKHVPSGLWVLIEGKIYGRSDGLEVVINLNTDFCAQIWLSGEIRVKEKNWLQAMGNAILELKKIGLVPAVRLGKEWEGNDYTAVKS